MNLFRLGATFALFAVTAVAEIGGCYATYAWLRMGRSAWWLVPGIFSLGLFAWLLTLHPTEGAGRIYAAYGGVYIMVALFWLWLVEGKTPDRWDMTGALVCLAGAAIILFAPRPS
jgi:small multidrug resistance family-3 protein